MSQQQKLEKVLDLLLSEDQDQAAELLHQIIVEKARTIYESIVDEEEVDVADEEDKLDEADEVGGDPSADFTDEISSDEEEVDSDEENNGEAGDDEESDDEESDDEGEFDGEGSTEERVEDLESQLAELRAEFDALMGEEMQEPNHADLAADMDDGEFDGEVAPADDDMGGMPDFGQDEKVVGEVVAVMHEKRKAAKLAVAPQAKDKKKDKKVDEETKFLQSVADTGQKGTAKLAGTGKNTPHGAEQTQSPYTRAPSKKDQGGAPVKFGSGTGGEYGKYNGDSAVNKTPSDNLNVSPKNSSIKADATAKYTGGKVAGAGFTKSPLTNKPS